MALVFGTVTGLRVYSAAPQIGVSPELGVQELLLDNGLRVLVVTDSRVPRVAASLWYRVGAIQEPAGEHGSTHFLEHAIHQGTTTIGTRNFEAEKPILREIDETEKRLLAARNGLRNRLREREISSPELVWPSVPETEELQRRLYELEDLDAEHRDYWAEYLWYRRYGGVVWRHTDPVPATTGLEHLEIDMDLPKENLELFFRLEADRMVNAVLRGWEAQRFTVIEQLLNGRSQPQSRFLQALNGVTGISHPTYVLGSSSGHFRDFANFSRAAMLRVYDDYFVPNNATVVLVGDTTLERIRPLAKRYFGRLPRGAEAPARMDLETEPAPGGRVRLDWSEPLDPRVLIRHRIPGVGHPDRPAFDTIAALLRGRHGVAQAKLAAWPGPAALTGAVQASAGRSGSPATFDVVALASNDEELPRIEEALLDLFDDLRHGEVDPGALERARTGLALDWAKIRSSRGVLSFHLGSFQVMDHWTTLLSFMNARQHASVADIQRRAQQYFIESNRVVATTRRHVSGTSSSDKGSKPVGMAVR